MPLTDAEEHNGIRDDYLLTRPSGTPVSSRARATWMFAAFLVSGFFVQLNFSPFARFSTTVTAILWLPCSLCRLAEGHGKQISEHVVALSRGSGPKHGSFWGQLQAIATFASVPLFVQFLPHGLEAMLGAPCSALFSTDTWLIRCRQSWGPARSKRWPGYM